MKKIGTALNLMFLKFPAAEPDTILNWSQKIFNVVRIVPILGSHEIVLRGGGTAYI